MFILTSARIAGPAGGTATIYNYRQFEVSYKTSIKDSIKLLISFKQCVWEINSYTYIIYQRPS